MCQKVYYTYACSHSELVVYRCPKCKFPEDLNCRNRPEPIHTRLEDYCFDCDELKRQIEELYHRNEARRIQQQMQSQSGTQSQGQGSGSQAQADQQQEADQDEDPRIALSGKGKDKALRPLETNKLSNMDCRLEGDFGLTPSDVHYFFFQPR